MKIIIRKMEDDTEAFEDFSEMSKEVSADITLEDDDILIACGSTLLQIPREVFTGIGI